jgi:hypothetical protein
MRAPERMTIREFIIGVLQVLAYVAGSIVVVLFLLFCATVGTWDADTFASLPCVTEDAPGPCYWDASTHGNGEGRSFTIDTLGRIHYWDEG